MADDEDIRCPICNLNLQVLTERIREEHCDACLDNAEYIEPVTEAPSANSIGVAKEVDIGSTEDDDASKPSIMKEESIISPAGSEPAAKPTVSAAAPAQSKPSSWFFDLVKRKRTEDVEPQTSVKRKSLPNFKEDVRDNLSEKTNNSNGELEKKVATVATTKPKERRSQRPMPFYKVLKFGTSTIAVDAFNYGSIPNVSGYYLSHFHSDHYGGLSKSWTHGPIYCSHATASLTRLKLRVSPEYLKPLDMNKEYEIDGVNVILLDANHCPGAAVFLFNKAVLHTGDFRATEQLVKELKLVSACLETIYLDTTYLDPDRKFPSQDLVVGVCAEYCAQFQARPVKQGFFTTAPKQRRVLVMCGTYTIGKERLAMAIANRLNKKIWAQPWKQKVLETIGDPVLNEPLSDDGTEAQVHLVSMGEISLPKLDEKWKFLKKHFTHLIAFVPTGWTWPKQSSGFNLKTLETPKTTTVSHGGAIRICRVPYSEHSSYSELEAFCKSVECRNLIATVHTKRYDILRKWEVR